VIRAKNSLLALNKLGKTLAPDALGPDCHAEVAGGIVSQGHNLLVRGAGCAGFGKPGDRIGVAAKIGPLRGNGGPTKTIALLKHSPAINHAGPVLQSGSARVKRSKPTSGLRS